MHRVRTLIPFLDYSSLRKEKILPKQALFTKVPKGGKFASLAEKMGYSEYGLFMEEIIQEAIICESVPLSEVFNGCKESVPKNLQKYFHPKDYIEVGKLVRGHFCKGIKTYLKGNVELPCFEPEWPSPEDKIVGHPDIVTNECVYDIKTTGRFNAMRISTIFQILSYYCLAQLKSLPIRSIGLILPAQNLIFKVNIGTWNWKPFWNKLRECISLKNQRESLYLVNPSEYVTFENERHKVGTHVNKDRLLEYLYYGRPLQFFVGGRCTTKVTSLNKSITDTLMNRLSPKIFIHSPYNINLSKPFGKIQKKEDDDLDIPWMCFQLRKIIKTGEKAGINGVVVHVVKEEEFP